VLQNETDTANDLAQYFISLLPRKTWKNIVWGSRGISPLILNLRDWMDVSDRHHALVTLLSGLASPMFVGIEGCWVRSGDRTGILKSRKISWPCRIPKPASPRPWSRFTVPTTLAVTWLSSSSRRENHKKRSVPFSIRPTLSHKLTRFSFSLIAPSKCGFRPGSNTIFFNNPPPLNPQPHAVTSSRVRLTESK
jgi:hypothetical protein